MEPLATTTQTLTSAAAVELLRAYRDGGYAGIFTVRFIKRTNGEERVMNCRFGVNKFSKGRKLLFDPDKKRLLQVCDVQIAARLKRQERALKGRRRPNQTKKKETPYRMINLDGLLEVRIDKKRYLISDPERKLTQGELF